MAGPGKSGRSGGGETLATTAASLANIPAAADALAAARAVSVPAFRTSSLPAAGDGPAAAPAAYVAPGPAPAGQADIDRQRGYQHLLGLQRHYEHKSKWSYFLMAMMAGMLGFQSILLGLVGAKIWDFTGYAWLLPALLVQNLAQIAGLCVIVVQSLFKDVG